MTERIGEYTLKFKSRPGIIASAAIVGSKEGDGPLGGCFDEVIADGTLGKETWEQAESALQQRAVIKAIEKSGMTAADILNTYDVDAMARIFREFGEERFAYPIAKRIAAQREKEPFTHTGQLVELIYATIPAAAPKADTPPNGSSRRCALR